MKYGIIILMKTTMIFLILFSLWNLFVFFLYGWDKHLARQQKYRISEKSLLLTAFFGGGIGAFLGMSFFHHKTKHRKFQILLPAFALLSLALLVAIFFCGS